jgi:hypothetical protein
MWGLIWSNLVQLMGLKIIQTISKNIIWFKKFKTILFLKKY